MVFRRPRAYTYIPPKIVVIILLILILSTYFEKITKFALAALALYNISMNNGLPAEFAFMHEASKRGYIVSIPQGNCRYDVVLDNGKELFKVQVKSTSKKLKRKEFTAYTVSITSKRSSKDDSAPSLRKRYTKKSVDVFAIYIVPTNTFYIIPIEDTGGRKNMSFAPNSEECYHKEFKENWDVFKA